MGTIWKSLAALFSSTSSTNLSNTVSKQEEVSAHKPRKAPGAEFVVPWGDLGGHFKTGQSWSAQNRPTD
jgi:hypothetical protein